VKALVVHPGPEFSVADVYTNIIKGLKANGVEVATVNLNDRLDFYTQVHIPKQGEFIKCFDEAGGVRMASKGIEVAAYEYWPDVIILVTGAFIAPETMAVLARRPHHVVLYCTEAPYEDDRHQRMARYVDTVIINDPATMSTYRQVNPRTWYLPHMWDQSVHAESTVERDIDFGWVGTAFPSRIEFFEDCDFGDLNVKLGGNWKQLPDGHHLEKYLVTPKGHCLDNAETADIYRRSKVSMNWYRKETSTHGTADGLAIGPREVELAATGTFFLREPRQEGDDLFPMLPTFETPEEFSKLLRWWVDNDDARSEAIAAARAAVADRRNDLVMGRLLSLIDGVGKSNPF